MLRTVRLVPAVRGCRRDERGVVALITGLVAIVLMLISAFVIDLGSTWARRGDLQVQADKAALLAARNLPATDDASRLKAASYVAYYIACHTLPGQLQLNPEIPSCPSGTTPSSASVQTYAQQLLTNGSVTFPKSTQVKVVGPTARVDFSFGKLAGVDGRTEQKMAIAQASSPGDLLPMGLSVPCLLSAVGNVPNAGDAVTSILPINYITSGPLTPNGSLTTVWPLRRTGWASNTMVTAPASRPGGRSKLAV
jgi:Flp pilus assembly protein TadG